MPVSTRRESRGGLALRIAVMCLALLWLYYALFPFIAGGWVVSQLEAVSAALFGFGVAMFLGATATIGSALWLLVRLGRPRRPLWIGGIGSVLAGAALSTAAFTHIYPCSGPD
ncbi:MAG: hypothetical protein WBQ09_16870 [Terriglobales bacterium]